MEEMTECSFRRLKQNIIDVIKEEQIKLGYRSETIRLYYPLSSLRRLVELPASGAEPDAEAMQRMLEQDFCGKFSGELGDIQVSRRGGRFCFQIPPEGAEYVHANTSDNEFLSEFVRTIEKEGCTMEDALAQFYRFSDHVRIVRQNGGEFDYLVWFEDGIPDSYRYCITDEGCHLIFHRFTAGDYEEMYGEAGDNG